MSDDFLSDHLIGKEYVLSVSTMTSQSIPMVMLSAGNGDLNANVHISDTDAIAFAALLTKHAARFVNVIERDDFLTDKIERPHYVLNVTTMTSQPSEPNILISFENGGLRINVHIGDADAIAFAALLTKHAERFAKMTESA